MLNFTVGPVMSNEEIRKIGGDQIPYFRTPEFSKIMLDNELLLKKFFKADDLSRVVFMTGSGTASMDASVLNLFTKEDKIRFYHFFFRKIGKVLILMVVSGIDSIKRI